MTRKITPKDGADAVAMLDQERTDDVPMPHLYRPIAASPNKSCADCFAIPTDPTFAEHHAMPSATKTPKRAAKAPTAKVVLSKAARARALFAKGMTVNEVAAKLPDVSVSYAWDIAAAMERSTGKTIIASHAPKAPAAKKATTPKRTSKKAPVAKKGDDQLAFKVVPTEQEAVAS